ncbi:ABC transporter permease [Bengtsoniella intestinalis]|uniref:ABC transporter permease n=1 Tax=Bengtsoniella intestinalis TaxID=3073143 RepID=UPI00391F5EAF
MTKQVTGEQTYKGRSMAQETWRRLLKNHGAVVGMVFLIALFLVALMAGVIYDYETDIISMGTAMSQSPSWEHPFGTDNLGRDILARIVYGARYSLLIGMGSVTLGLCMGVVTGSMAGFYGGAVDQVVMRANDILYSIPNIMLAVVIVSMMGTGVSSLLVALSISSATAFAKITRAAVMSIRGQEFIESAYALGLPTWKIIAKHVIPNCMSPIIVQVTLAIGSNIIAASSLSFLGVGIDTPKPEWGTMLADGRNFIRSEPWMCIFPGLAIMFTVLALNLLGDGLRDALDPKLKK